MAATGAREAYYTETRGTPQELVSAVKWGFLYQGQSYAWQKQRRGPPAVGLPATAFIPYLQSHDQVANSPRAASAGAAHHAGALRALTALLLLAPGAPLLFQGPGVARASLPLLRGP